MVYQLNVHSPCTMHLPTPVAGTYRLIGTDRLQRSAGGFNLLEACTRTEAGKIIDILDTLIDSDLTSSSDILCRYFGSSRFHFFFFFCTDQIHYEKLGEKL